MSDDECGGDVEAFNATLKSLLYGIFADAQHDGSYQAAKLVWDAYEATKRAEKPDFLYAAFIELVSRDAVVRACIREKNTEALEVLCVDRVPQAQALFDSLADDGGFKHDTLKKAWKRVQKLVYRCNLAELVSLKAAAAATVKPISAAAAQRIARFNEGYRAFLGELESVFPPSSSSSLAHPLPFPQALFDEAVARDNTAVIARFKKVLFPLVPKIMTAVQKGSVDKTTTIAVTQAAVLEPYVGADPTWFKTLPCVGESALQIDAYWPTTMVFDDVVAHDSFVRLTLAEQATFEAANAARVSEWRRVAGVRDGIIQALVSLTGAMTGIDALIHSPIVKTLKEKAIEIMTRENITTASFTPTSPSFDRKGITALVLELVATIPAATNNKITTDDVQQLLTMATSGKMAALPDSFAEVFSPDMLDVDCLLLLQEMPGVLGDVLGPMLAAYEGSMTGKTGTKSPFASVKNPAWLTKK